VRSPFSVDCKEHFENDNRKIGLGIDGEFYDLRDAKSINFSIDPACPKLKVLKRSNFVTPGEQNKDILTGLKEEFESTLF
jgi:hypothetical protein